LEIAGPTVRNASSAEKGFKRALEEKPDLVVLDVIMDSVLDGVSTSDLMYGDDQTKNIPIIMVTSIANTDYADLFPTDQNIHIDAFLTKPVAPASLLKQVDKLLAKK